MVRANIAAIVPAGALLNLIDPKPRCVQFEIVHAELLHYGG
jgi:hypothetical protein